MKKRVGIMGGTFDPIHYGHLLIAENAADQFDLEEVRFMPTGQSPHKEDAGISDPAARSDMVRLAILNNPRFRLSQYEMFVHEVNYTYRTLEELKANEREEDLFFIMGGDSLFVFESWMHPERIVKAATILAAVRQDWEGTEFDQQIQHLNRKYGERFFRLDTPNVSFSSRHIRARIQEDKSARYMLPNKVIVYIKENGLYGAKPGNVPEED